MYYLHKDFVLYDKMIHKLLSNFFIELLNLFSIVAIFQSLLLGLNLIV